MQIKQALIDYPHIDKRVKMLRAEIDHIVSDRYSTKITPAYTGMPHASGVGDPTGTHIDALDDRISISVHKTIREIECLIQTKALVDKRMAELKEQEYQMVYARYMRRDSWSLIALDHGYTDRHVKRIIKMAIDRMEGMHG